MRKQILVVDSDRRQYDRIMAVLRKAVLKWGGEGEIYHAVTLAQAECLIRHKQMELLIVDVVCNEQVQQDYTEIEWIKGVRKIEKYNSLPLVVLSSDRKWMQYAYTKLQCLGFLPRAFEFKELFYILEKAMKYVPYREEERYLLLRTKGIWYPVKLEEILYMEARERILYVYQKNGEILSISHKPLGEILQETKAECLLQCSKNTLVNKNYVEEINLKEGYLCLEGVSKKIAIGKTYIPIIKVFMESRKWEFVHVK